jgi:hypothetical protein
MELYTVYILWYVPLTLLSENLRSSFQLSVKQALYWTDRNQTEILLTKTVTDIRSAVQ